MQMFNSQKLGVCSGELAAFLSGSESPSKHSLKLCKGLCVRLASGFPGARVGKRREDFFFFLFKILKENSTSDELWHLLSFWKLDAR